MKNQTICDHCSKVIIDPPIGSFQGHPQQMTSKGCILSFGIKVIQSEPGDFCEECVKKAAIRAIQDTL